MTETFSAIDPFRRLPVELIFQIFEDTADFVGVESLISVSRPARAAFYADPQAIMQAILISNPITLQPELRSLVSNIAILHNPSSHCSTLDDYEKVTALNDKLYSSQRFQSPEVACRILHIAAQIQRLGCVCLSKLQKEFASAVGISPLLAQQANEPFSWIEEYRMYWALWHLRCYSDLRKSVDKRFSSFYNTGNPPDNARWSWPSESIQALDLYPTSDDIHEFRKEVIWTVAVALEDLKTCSPSALPGDVLQPEYKSTLSWDLHPNTPIPFFSSFKLPQTVETQYPIWSPPPVPAKNPVTTPWRLLPTYCTNPTGQTALFRSLRFQVMRRGPDRRAMNDVLRYRRCGVLLWDKWRMFSTGLIPNNFRERVPAPGGMFIEARSEVSQGMGDVLPMWLEVGRAKQ
ncbi:hypothetical protein N7481_003535 [Penicillium waksmanii]|uniref:uncharacterized protein n=1 Tax=Penicillium waksmanii TaxID=69791 RepID=UPI0025471B8A|nr:uncharacterized protein N7481_003535 [Penicillium waksmanii]KAJ5988325.1 hypothetical protein N7481_003535 [Penicillium waksmanii]